MGKRIAIIGGGFAGTEAARTFSGREHEVHLFDPRPAFEFLPLLPDLLGGRYSVKSVSTAFHLLAEKFKFTFHQARISSVDPERCCFYIDEERFDFDYLLISTGGTTDFHGNETAAEKSYTARSIAGIQALLRAFDTGNPEAVILVGGGYTGLETASQLRRRARKKGWETEILIIEKQETILSEAAPEARKYIEKQLENLGIAVLTATSLAEISEEGARLSSGRTVDRPLVIWNAGVSFPRELWGKEVDLDPAGRVRVDQFGRIGERCWAAGDNAHVGERDTGFPMASYLAIQQASSAARNILRHIDRKSLQPYRPHYYGYVIPLANGYGIGRIAGFNLKGRLPVLIHHAAGILRTFSPGGKRRMLQELMREGISMGRFKKI
jgi:NADH:ubiquinone reductase (H+-translocating)